MPRKSRSPRFSAKLTDFDPIIKPAIASYRPRPKPSYRPPRPKKAVLRRAIEKDELRAALARKRRIASLGDLSRPLHRPISRHERDFLELYFLYGADEMKAVNDMFPGKGQAELQAIAKKLLRKKDVRAVMQIYARTAVDRVEVLAETAESEKVKLDANLAILDRAGYAPPKEQHQHNTLIIQIPEALARKNGIAESNAPLGASEAIGDERLAIDDTDGDDDEIAEAEFSEIADE